LDQAGPIAPAGEPVVSISGKRSCLINCRELATASGQKLSAFQLVWCDGRHNLVAWLTLRGCGR